MHVVSTVLFNHAGTMSWSAVAGVLLITALRLWADVGRWRERWNAPISARERDWIVKTRGRGLSDGTLITRMARGARTGVALPGIFALVIVYYYVKDGRHPDVDTDMLALLVCYLVGSVVLVAGMAACTPCVLRSWWHAILASCVATTPLVLGVGATVSAGFAHWDTPRTILSTIVIVVFGTTVGIATRRGLLRRASVLGSPTTKSHGRRGDAPDRKHQTTRPDATS